MSVITPKKYSIAQKNFCALLCKKLMNRLSGFIVILVCLQFIYSVVPAYADSHNSTDINKPVAPTVTANSSNNEISKPTEHTSTGNTTTEEKKESAPIEIEADSAEQNEKLGITTYRGNVSVIRENLTILAEKVQIYSSIKNDANKRTIEKIIATGSPANFTHDAENIADRLVAEAKKINYLPKTGIIKLEENASLVQHGSSVKR